MVHHYVPTIHPFHRHFVNFPTPRRCHACSESGHIAAFGCSCPPNHPHPGVTPLKHWPQRPTTTLQLPPATFCSCACAHLHLQPDHAAFGPAHPSLPFQHLGQFGPPLAPKVILPVGWHTHYVPTTTSHLPPALCACACACVLNLATLPHLDVSICPSQ